MFIDILCLDFLVSEWHDFRGRWVDDLLLKPEWVEEFVQEWKLWVESPPTPAIQEQLLALRSLIRRMVEALQDGAVADEDLRELNKIMQSVPHVSQLLWDGEKFQLEAVAVERDWNWVMAEIATSFAELLAHGDRRRLKVCENEHCRTIFYDESKSRTRRYCTNTKCGNLWKLRRFRARHKAVAHVTPKDAL
ncbi:MAG TPA: ABATE domain-containing protein [Ktedonosporobacter sp.]|nr:ABATE domain-containing protein [Ktedonosporobacter sp.]